MDKLLFPIFAGSYNDPEYYNLSKEEREYMDFVDKCINSKDKRISDASFQTMLMLLEISNDPDKYEPEEIQERRDKIVVGLNEKEVEMMDKFLLACINSMGIYSEDAKYQRRLKKERND
ncbi:MAG: hypothetical protein IKR57_05065 [Bacilli bacterium]|nr:hypothetical protein [Bacilli bacterium]